MDIRVRLYSQLRHWVPYAMFLFGFGILTFENRGSASMEDIAGVLKEMFKRRTEFVM